MGMRTFVKTRAVGGSLIVTIPKEIAEAEDLKEGELEKAKKSFFGAAKGIGPFTKEDELKTHE
jgi:hypothetical protein